MDTTTAVVMTGGLTAAGRWSEGKPIDIRIAIGVAAFAISLSLIENANADLAGKFGLLVLIVAMFRYVPPIARKTGLIADTRKVAAK